jgi:hypothetical protein
VNAVDRELRKVQGWAHRLDPEWALLSLELETASKREIPNQQVHEPMSAVTENNEKARNKSMYGKALVQVTDTPTAAYNCHGLVFASRRTNVHGNDVRMILNGDRYKKRLDPSEVRPGDVVLFVAPDGDIEHSGIVVEPPSLLNGFVPVVHGKWGKFLEYAHPANASAYKPDHLEYYRVDWA